MFLFWWLVGSITKVFYGLVNEICSIDGCWMLLAAFGFNALTPCSFSISSVRLPFGKLVVVQFCVLYMLAFEQKD